MCRAGFQGEAELGFTTLQGWRLPALPAVRKQMDAWTLTSQMGARCTERSSLSALPTFPAGFTQEGFPGKGSSHSNPPGMPGSLEKPQPGQSHPDPSLIQRVFLGYSQGCTWIFPALKPHSCFSLIKVPGTTQISSCRQKTGNIYDYFQ